MRYDKSKGLAQQGVTKPERNMIMSGMTKQRGLDETRGHGDPQRRFIQRKG
jgi:hypothetical protein